MLAAVLTIGTGAGTAVATSPAPTGTPSSGQAPSGTRPAAVGTITQLGSGSITVKALGGKSEVVTYTSSTTITKAGSSATATPKVGEMVAVQGTTSDGTVAATSIQILPKRGMGKGRPPGSGNGSRPPAGTNGGTPPAA